MALWDRLGSRGNVEDRRGMGGALGGLGITGVLLVVALTYLSGGDLGDVISQLPIEQIVEQRNIDPSLFAGEDSYEVFASTVLGSNNELWQQVFSTQNKVYAEPKLVLFRGGTQSACGGATSAVGPHYCPLDSTIYLDETFFDELTRRFGAKGGDVAEAYVIAHEVGHHAQHELGIMDQVGKSNEDSIKLELQADCFAGMWAHSIADRGVFEPGELSEAIDAASAVGDDRIQESIEGRVTPENWTHGSSEERVAWFTKGSESGSLSSCNTFQ